MKPVIAITIGDPNGIGPEIVLKALHNPVIRELCSPVVISPVEVLSWYMNKLDFALPIRPITSLHDIDEGCVNLIVVDGEFNPEEIGKGTKTSGAISLRAIERAFAVVVKGEAGALVTAPISKETIHLAGSPFKGHTDMLAHLCDSKGDVLMILASERLRVALVTDHIPLRDVARAITKELLKKKIHSTERALKQDFGIPSPRIALLGLNPHAGDGGVLGMEEEEVIRPAIDEARHEGIQTEGPFAADGYFSQYTVERHDIVLAMYHDQGLAPFKLQADGAGVNITAGLPIVRTSPDHGTAFSLAGKGIASEVSLCRAIQAAVDIHHRRMEQR